MTSVCCKGISRVSLTKWNSTCHIHAVPFEIKWPNGTCRIDLKEPNEERRGRQPFVTKEAVCYFIQIPNEPTCAYERNSSEIVVWSKLENHNRHYQTRRTGESDTTTRQNEVVKTLLKDSPTVHGRTRQIIRYRATAPPPPSATANIGMTKGNGSLLSRTLSPMNISWYWIANKAAFVHRKSWILYNFAPLRWSTVYRNLCKGSRSCDSFFNDTDTNGWFRYRVRWCHSKERAYKSITGSAETPTPIPIVSA